MKRATLCLAILVLAVVALAPGRPARAACPAPSTNYGSASATINIPSTGTYRIWSRIYAPTAQNNSYYLEVDGTCYTVGDKQTATSQELNSWQWVDYQNGNISSKITKQMNPGQHTVKLIGREPDVKLDRLLFLTDSCIPSGTGGNCLEPGPAPGDQVRLPFRMNAGGANYTDTNGNLWIADAYFSGGQTDSQAAGKPIIGSGGNDTLYQDGRWGMNGYSVPVANGTYKLVLHFAEIYPPCIDQQGCRVFSVTAEGKPILTNFDIVKAAGAGYKADTQSFTVTVSDGRLDIGFQPNTNEPSLTGLQILPQDTAGTPPTTAHQNKVLVRPDGRAYYIADGERHHIGNVPIRDCIIGRLGTDPDFRVSDAIIDSYQETEAAHCPYELTLGANFVREANDPTVWLVLPNREKKHASVLCAIDAYTTAPNKYRVWVVPEGETAGHKNIGVFKGTPTTCAALPG